MDVEAEIAKAKWVIEQNAHKPHVVAKWTTKLESLTTERDNDLISWIAKARVALDNIERLIVGRVIDGRSSPSAGFVIGGDAPLHDREPPPEDHLEEM